MAQYRSEIFTVDIDIAVGTLEARITVACVAEKEVGASATCSARVRGTLCAEKCQHDLSP
eukprot:SAG11_NODE_808_length_7088_cov_5.136357_1_plen_60_part_00